MHTTRELLLIMSDFPTPGTPQMIKFSPRGKEVVEFFMRGFTYKEIAERLGISLSGVKRHKEKMLIQNNCATMLEL